MNTQSYISGNLALSIYPDSDTSLVVIDGGLGASSVDESGDSVRSSRAYAKISHAIIGFLSVISIAACAFFATYHIASLIVGPTYESLEHMDLQTVRVKQGQTLWELAELYDADGVSTQDMVSAIREWNDLDTSMLSAGQSLLVANPS